MGAVGSYVQAYFEACYQSRLPYEQEWQEIWDNYNRRYGQQKKNSSTEGTEGRSRLFVGATMVKCDTAFSKIIDAQLAGRSVLPYDIEPLTSNIKMESEQILQLKVARKRKIEDYQNQIRLKPVYSNHVHQLTILGNAVMRSPVIIKSKEQGVVTDEFGNEFVQDVEKELVGFRNVSIWNYYFDPNAESPAESMGEIEFSMVHPAKFMGMKDIKDIRGNPYYNKEMLANIERYTTNFDYHSKLYIILGDKYQGENYEKDMRVPIIDYWGIVPRRMLRDDRIYIPDKYRDKEYMECHVVLCGSGDVLHCSVNEPGERPFLFSKYSSIPDSPYGVGVGYKMMDSQSAINTTTRMLLDNKMISGSGMLVINDEAIDTVKQGGDYRIGPGKHLWLKRGFKPEDAIKLLTFQDISQGLMEVKQEFERLADDESGIPKYTQGSSDSFLNKTATGISMLITNALVGLKTTMENLDPAIEKIITIINRYIDIEDGMPLPFKVVAQGSAALIAKEMKIEAIQKTLMFAASNPQAARCVDWLRALQELADLLGVDILLTPEQIKQNDEAQAKAAKEQQDQALHLEVAKIETARMKVGDKNGAGGLQQVRPAGPKQFVRGVPRGNPAQAQLQG